MANVNFGAMGYLGLLVALGATIGGISRVVSGGNFIEIVSGNFGYPPNLGYQKNSQSSRLINVIYL